jgi:hypothetical protein
MYYNNYGLDPYMYDDPYTFLQKAQVGLEMPAESDYKSYNEFQRAYDTWKLLNSSDSTAGRERIQQNPVLAANPSLVSTPSSAVYEGPSVWDLLTAKNLPGDLKSRKKYAKILGIENYTGRKDQNQLMIDIIKQNPSVIPTIMNTVNGPSKKGSQPATAVVTQTPNTNNVDSIPLIKTDSNLVKTPPVPGKGKTSKSESNDSQFEKALIAMFSIAAAGGMTAGAISEAKEVAKSVYGLKGPMLKNAIDILSKNLAATTKKAVKAWDDLGPVGQREYRRIEKGLRQQRIKEAKDVRETFALLKQEEAGVPIKLTPKKLPPPSPVRASGAKAPKPTSSGVSRVVMGAKPASRKAPVPVAPSGFSKYAASIMESPFYKGAQKYADELGTFVKKAPSWISKMFEEGGEQEMNEGSDMEQQLISYVASQLQNRVDPQEIVQDLMTQGISQDQAIDIIEQVGMFLEQQGVSPRPQQQEQQEQQVPSEEEMMRYGGGYSGTYDAGSGSYFASGGSFVPTYGDILPEYMYGHMMQEGGSLNIGDTLEVTPEEMEYLRQQGYEFDTI